MTFTIENGQFNYNGSAIKIISGAVHYFRNLPDMWDDIFEKNGCDGLQYGRDLLRVEYARKANRKI